MVTLVSASDAKFVDDPNHLPEWISLVDEFRFECNKLNRKSKSHAPLRARRNITLLVEHLKDDQESFLRSKATLVFEERSCSTQEGFETDIEIKSQEIGRLFARVHGLTTEMKGIL